MISTRVFRWYSQSINSIHIVSFCKKNVKEHINTNPGKPLIHIQKTGFGLIDSERGFFLAYFANKSREFSLFKLAGKIIQSIATDPAANKRNCLFLQAIIQKQLYPYRRNTQDQVLHRQTDWVHSKQAISKKPETAIP
jgi:hypothetical protein